MLDAGRPWPARHHGEGLFNMTDDLDMAAAQKVVDDAIFRLMRRGKRVADMPDAEVDRLQQRAYAAATRRPRTARPPSAEGR